MANYINFLLSAHLENDLELIQEELLQPFGHEHHAGLLVRVVAEGVAEHQLHVVAQVHGGPILPHPQRLPDQGQIHRGGDDAAVVGELNLGHRLS